MKKLPVVTRLYAWGGVTFFSWMLYLYVHEHHPSAEGLARTNFLGWRFDTGALLTLVTCVFIATLLMGVVAYFIEKRLGRFWGRVLAVIPVAGIGLAAYYSPYALEERTPYEPYFAKDSHVDYPLDTQYIYPPNSQEHHAMAPLPLLVMFEKSFTNMGDKVMCPMWLYERKGPVFVESHYTYDPERYSWSSGTDTSAYDAPEAKVRACDQIRNELFARYDWEEVSESELQELANINDHFKNLVEFSIGRIYRPRQER
ncbi:MULTISPECIES: hypothetical protein [unclassified Halomonas]|uniref:hypothetical protein n=1 Tax=unclassified Halomonas TaxID=2609666 RepID=UPI0021E38EA1|nr:MULTISPECIES: hypothetical protein [unclassified Halomonas]UYG00316.1 hypothetical protein OCT39_01810 [Halomonas sp. GD1P12]WNL41951.1 hypothetical protein RN347_15190 [Halomonas sp. PAMB 3264]